MAAIRYAPFKDNPVLLDFFFYLCHVRAFSGPLKGSLKFLNDRIHGNELGRPMTFVKFYNPQHVFCHEASYRPCAVTGHNDGLFWTEQKVRGMKIFLLFFVIGSGHPRYFLRDQAVTDWKGDPMFINHLSRFLNRVDRCCNDLDLFRLEFLIQCLEVSQLLIAERSPMTAIDQDYTVSLPYSFRKFQLSSGDQPQLQLGKHIVGI
jgi:hypothetical protein